MPVDIPGDLLADIGISRGLGALGQHARFSQRGNPHLPVLAAHHGHGVIDFFLRRRLQMEVLNRLFIRVHTFLRGGLPDGFERRIEHLAGLGVRASGRRQAIDHQIHLPQIRFDQVDHPRLHLIGERVTVQTFGVEPRLVGELMESRRVIPARRARFAVCPRLLEKDTNRGGTRTKCRGNARGQAVSG